MIAIFVTCLYLLIGLLLWEKLDKDCMDEEVPYGRFPSIAGLEQIRWATALVLMFFWLPLFVTAYMRKKGKGGN